MTSPSLTGFSPNNPTRYLGPNIALVAVVTVNREPTGADIKQPNTGKYYSFGTLWLVGKNPTTGAYGDLWYLSNIVANVGNWVKISSASGPVITVSGTPNRITSTGGANTIIDIAATYVGQTSITTLGTIATGVWNGTPIAADFGGTGQTAYTIGDILYASGVSTLTKLPVGTSSQVLTVSGGLPSWTTVDGVGSWEVISASQSLVNNTGYICVSPGGALVLTLPLTSPVGSEIEVTLDGATSFRIAQNAGQSIRLADATTTVGAGGSITTTQQGDSIRMVCSVANTKWNILSWCGNLTYV